MGIDAGAVAGPPAEVPVEGSGRARGSVLLAVVAVVVALDWSSKILASTSLDDGPVSVGSVLTLRLGHNPGIAFGLGDRLPDVALLLVTLAVTALLAVAALRGAFPSTPAAGLILGGAVGNLVDRAIGASVVDFIDLGWWPSFNVADVALTVGCAWLFVASFRDAPSTAVS